jgi:subfamily B ATP-binding cassette protein MsbA
MPASLRQLLELLRNLNQLRPHLRPNRWLVFSAIAAATLSALLEGFGIGLLVPLISLLQGNAETVLKGRFLKWLPELVPNQTSGTYVGIFCGLVLGAIIAKNVVMLGYQRLMARFSRRVSVNLRDSLFHRLIGASLHVFEENRGGEFMHVYANETIKTQAAVEFLLLFIQRSLLGIFYFILLLVLSWEITLALLVLVVCVSSFISLITSRLGRHGAERTEVQKRLFGFVAAIFAGIRVVRATHAETAAVKEFKQHNEGLGRVEFQGSFLQSLMTPIAESVVVAGAMLIITGAYVLLIQQGKLSPNELMVIGLVLIRLLPLVNQLNGVIGQLNWSAGGVKEALRWIDVGQFPARAFGPKEFTGVRHGLRLENVGFTYPNGTVALRDVSLEIPAGSTVALVGSSGSGKTTLASLLLRLREPSAGRILVDGVDYWEFSAHSWHRRLGMVEQEAYLFNESIRYNLTIGCADASEEQLRRAIQIAHFEEVVAAQEKGLETTVGERGTMLSGGQKQRLAIARAMVRDPHLLILDEATSALDNVSERQVQAALDDARQGRTSVVIAHRLSTIRNADLIVVMEGGRIVETGRWEELAERPGPFQRLLAAAEGSLHRPAKDGAANPELITG